MDEKDRKFIVRCLASAIVEMNCAAVRMGDVGAGDMAWATRDISRELNIIASNFSKNANPKEKSDAQWV